eukprot:5097498-Prymnesium_polylepis.1
MKRNTHLWKGNTLRRVSRQGSSSTTEDITRLLMSRHRNGRAATHIARRPTSCRHRTGGAAPPWGLRSTPPARGRSAQSRGAPCKHDRTPMSGRSRDRCNTFCKCAGDGLGCRVARLLSDLSLDEDAALQTQWRARCISLSREQLV